jgi:hypothetical protein
MGMKLKPYQIVAGGVFSLAILMAVAYAIYIVHQNTSYNFGNAILLDFIIVGLLVWIGSIVLLRKGKSQNGSEFINTILISLIPTVVCLGVYFFVFTSLAFRNFSF